MLLGLVRPDAGTGTVLGAPIDEPAAYLPRVGALIESPAFYPALTGAENLRMFATVGGHDTASIPALLDARRPRRPRRRPLPQLLARDEAAARHRRRPARRSRAADPRRAGQRPRPAGRARDARARSASLAGTGRTVLVSSHDLSELEQVCDWLVLIDTGRSLYQGRRASCSTASSRGLAVAPERARRRPRAASVLLVATGFERRSRRTSGSSSAIDGARRRRRSPRRSTAPRSTPGSCSSSSARCARRSRTATSRWCEGGAR